MSIRQISVFLENKPGMLNKMTEVLAEHSIDMRALSIAETKDFGIARMIVDDVYAATNVLKEADFVASLTQVLAYQIPDETGGLNDLHRRQSEHRVHVRIPRGRYSQGLHDLPCGGHQGGGSGAGS